ncbi:MAG: hypothetical protein HOV79_07515 [Hamadaea sp.]|nr:hypothetical protein [Hamadaea sp.]
MAISTGVAAQPLADPDGNRARSTTWLPYALLGLLFVLMTVFTVTQYAVHGRSWDDWMQDDYGKRLLQFYLTLGEDRSFMEMAPNLYMPQHGAAYETIVALVQHFTGEQWHTRSVVGGITGLIGILAIALCGRELAGPWGAFTAALGLALYPRYVGSMFNNSKDIPFAVAMIIALWLVLRLVRRWQEPGRRSGVLDGALAGAAIGFAAAIRVNAMAWFAILALLVAAYWLRRRPTGARAVRAELARQAGTLLVIGCTCYLVMSLTWPYLLVEPINGLFDSVKQMSAYQWNHEILYRGEMVYAPEAPWHYSLVWLIVGSPLPMVVLSIAAIGVVLWRIAVPRSLTAPASESESTAAEPATDKNGQYLVLALYVVVPLSLIVALQPTLYNSLRQFLYVVPGFLLIATVVLLGAVRHAVRSGRRSLKILAAGLVGLAVLGQAEAVAASARIYPYEYAYFSPIVGGYAQARHGYESEYWGSCAHAAATWLDDHYREFPVDKPTFQDFVSWNPLVEQELPNVEDVGDGNPVFAITKEPKDGYRQIHAVVVEDEVLCQVGIRSDIPLP